jgi:hypothetical protein
MSFGDLSSDALAGIRLWLEQNPPAIPIKNILGYSQAVVQQAPTSYTDGVATAEATTTSTYGDLTTPGPTVTGLPSGNYMVFYACQAAGDAPTVAGPSTLYTFPHASIKFGTDEAADADALVTAAVAAGAYTTLSGFKAVTLPDATNTVTMRYRTAGANPVVVGSQFQNRRLVVLRYAAL